MSGVEKSASVPKVLTRMAMATLAGVGIFAGSVPTGATSSAANGGEIAFIGKGRLMLVGDDGGRVRPLAKAKDVTSFEWSPDGRRLVFVRNILVGYDRDYEIRRPAIFIANADGSGERRLSPRGTHDLNPTWSPDGRKIAFERAADLVDGLKDDIWVMNADGSGSLRLTRHPVLDREPTWSPDGRRIAWVRGWPDALHVMVMNADGSDQHRLLESTLQTTNPAWAPNGRLLAVTGFDTHALYSLRPDGSNLRRLVKGLDFDTLGVWAPDSRRLAYSHASVFVVETHGERPVPVRLHRGYSIDWSPDGRAIASDDQAGVFVMRDNGTRVKRLAVGRDPQWRP